MQRFRVKGLGFKVQMIFGAPVFVPFGLRVYKAVRVRVISRLGLKGLGA